VTYREKLIEDALTAFADRDITPPSKDDLRIALDAFDASLTRCGCRACTTARRDRIALTEHDRTSIARALHEIVYSPGANYDRAVPGIQEHMLACAEKVAAALPWLAPHTATDTEREALDAEARAESERELPPLIVNGIDTMASGRVGYAHGYVAGALRRSVVPEPSAEEPECFAEKPSWPDHWTTNDKLRDLHARWHEQTGNLIGREECGYERCEFWDAAEFTLRLADVRITGREPQDDPSDGPNLIMRLGHLRQIIETERLDVLFDPEVARAARLADLDEAIATLRAAAEQGENRG